MKRIIFALLCICLLSMAAAAYAGGDPEGYTVKYYKNNCLAEVPEDETLYQYGDEVEVLFEPVQYMNGLIFHGWDWNDDGIADFGYNYNKFPMPDVDVVLKAICVPAYGGTTCTGCHLHGRPNAPKLEYFTFADSGK